MQNQMTTGLIILAAGASSRMGKPKQTLKFQNHTLLQNAVRTAIKSVCRPIVAVLGAKADKLKGEVISEVQVAVNPHWQTGISGSIKCGLEKVLEADDKINAVLIMVCDQPLVSVEILNRLVETHQTTSSLIVACRYAETCGVPALFDRELFPLLFELENHGGGAKRIIERFRDRTTAVTFPEGAFDIDTPEDYLKLRALENQI